MTQGKKNRKKREERSRKKSKKSYLAKSLEKSPKKSGKKFWEKVWLKNKLKEKKQAVGFLKNNWKEGVGILAVFGLLGFWGYLGIWRVERKRERVKEEIIEIEPAEYPLKLVEGKGRPEPYLTAQVIEVVDLDSGVVLFERNAEVQVLPASLTKIMTALVVLENYDLDDIVEINGVSGIEGARMGLREGDRVTVYNLLYGLLLPSGNDAAYVLASHFEGGIESFIGAMNKKAGELGMKKTQFQNVAGLGVVGHYTTAKDLLILTEKALNNKIFAKIVATPRAVVPNADYSYWYSMVNVNELVASMPGVLGVKTGFTDLAGENLVVYVNREGRRLLAAVLNSRDRFGETKRLVEWIYENYEWKKL